MLGRSGSLGGDQLNAERVRDLARDLILQREEVGEIAVIAFGPDVLAGLGLDELRSDADAIAGFAQAAFEDVTARDGATAQ